MPASIDPDRTEWDVVVIGGGPPGEVAAQYATQDSGLEAVIVEAELVGGECSYWACMPSKGLLRPVEVLDLGRHLAGVKEAIGDRTVDVDAVLARRDSIVNHLDDSSQVQWCMTTGIDVIRGHGRLDGERRVVVTKPDGGTRTITARQAVVLGTGTSASVPDIPGLRAARPWISRDVTNLHTVPRRVVIVGGGPVACEAATWLLGLGVVELTLVQDVPYLLAKNEPFAGAMVADGLRACGARVELGTTVRSVSRAEVNAAGCGEIHGGEVVVTLAKGATVVADEIVVAAGRRPRSDDIGLASVGVEAGGFVTVDDHLTVTGVRGGWLYAVGDVNGRALLTHMGKYQARIAGAVIAARAQGKPLDGGTFSRHLDHADHDQVPQVTFTEPAVGSVGLTERDARDAGIDVEAVEYDLAALGGTRVLRDDYVGRAKLVIDPSTDTVVGATFVGTEISDLVHGATIAIVTKTPLAALWHAVPSYPTPSEIWLRLLETLAKQRSDTEIPGRLEPT
ncbi:MAG: pyridine nucleotide-disulfide oxidoreductase dimerization region [Actinomycetia bacterium]|nr:pyridine nucleotide-disulfide oxidoreductase dimerization region [Actinomycetes bacterium]